jgi:hypothetical protein
VRRGPKDKKERKEKGESRTQQKGQQREKGRKEKIRADEEADASRVNRRKKRRAGTRRTKKLCQGKRRREEGDEEAKNVLPHVDINLKNKIYDQPALQLGSYFELPIFLWAVLDAF